MRDEERHFLHFTVAVKHVSPAVVYTFHNKNDDNNISQLKRHTLLCNMIILRGREGIDTGRHGQVVL